MSNAMQQIQRVNIREGNGNGNNGSNGGYEASIPYCVDLEPTPDEVKAELKSHTITKVGDKLVIGKYILKQKDGIANKVVCLGHNNLAGLFLKALPEDFKGVRKKRLYCYSIPSHER